MSNGESETAKEIPLLDFLDQKARQLVIASEGDSILDKTMAYDTALKIAVESAKAKSSIKLKKTIEKFLIQVASELETLNKVLAPDKTPGVVDDIIKAIMKK